MRRTVCLAVVTVFASLSACSGGPDEGGDAAAGGADLPGASDGVAGDGGDPTEETPSNCLSVSRGMAKAIARGAEEGTGFKPLAAAAYKSPHFSKVYFIAMRFSATGVGDQQGVWVSNSLRPGGGLILSADGFAKNFTTWHDAATTDAQIDGADPGIEKALGCL